MQQINLYLEEFKEKRIPFAFETFVFMTFGCVMFCFMASVVAFIMYVSAAEHIRNAMAELNSVQTEFELAQTEYKIIDIDSRLQSRIKNMEKRRSQNDQLLSYLAKRNLRQHQQSFAGMLKALTRIKEPGLWLTEVRFEQAGDGLALEGYALNPQSVPRYINKLGLEDAFSGMQFKVFNLSRHEGQLAFTLSSQRQENEMNDALMEVLSETVQPAQVK